MKILVCCSQWLDLLLVGWLVKERRIDVCQRKNMAVVCLKERLCWLERKREREGSWIYTESRLQIYSRVYRRRSQFTNAPLTILGFPGSTAGFRAEDHCPLIPQGWTMTTTGTTCGMNSILISDMLGSMDGV